MVWRLVGTLVSAFMLGFCVGAAFLIFGWLSKAKNRIHELEGDILWFRLAIDQPTLDLILRALRERRARFDSVLMLVGQNKDRRVSDVVRREYATTAARIRAIEYNLEMLGYRTLEK